MARFGDTNQGRPIPGGRAATQLERRMLSLQRRLVREATMATAMLERSLEALLNLDSAIEAEVRGRDDRIDAEEVAIEVECFSILTLEHPYARDFRMIAFVLKTNADVERVADHACSIAKLASRIEGPIEWPMALRELAQRVPVACHKLLRAVVDQDVEAARELVRADKTIDRLDKRLYEEAVEMMGKEPTERMHRNGLYLYRAGRELERVGDLVANIAEDIVFLATGEIIRHTIKKNKPGREAS